MADFAAVRDGVKTVLDTIPGLRAYDIVPGDMSPPAAIVSPAHGTFITYGTSLGRGSDDMAFTILLLVSSAWQRSAADLLDSYLAGSGSKSIVTAFENNPVVGAQFAFITSASSYGQIVFNGTRYYGCQLHLRIGVV